MSLYPVLESLIIGVLYLAMMLLGTCGGVL